MTNLHSLAAQQQELQAQMNAALHPIIADIHKQLATAPVQKLVKSLTEISETLPVGMVKEQVGNVITVLTAVPEYLASEVKRLAPAEDAEAVE